MIKISNDLYEFNLWVSFEEDPDKTIKWVFEEYNMFLYPITSHADFSPINDKNYLVRVPEFDIKKVGHMPLLCHELLHATFKILEDVGLKLNSGSEEAYTYLFQHLMDKFLEELNK